MKKIISKIASRKFLTCIAGFVMGLCLVFGVDENTVSVIAGAVTSIASVVSYIIAEGKVDAAAVGSAQNAVKDALDAVDKIEE